MPKKIVVFADGTGNAFTVQESNVWRLYEALDQTRPDQIAHYIKGVGTSGFKPFAVLDLQPVSAFHPMSASSTRSSAGTGGRSDEIYMFGSAAGPSPSVR